MAHGSFPADWLNRFADPYAVLGIAVTADDRRVLKRYRNVARFLHPDSQAQADAGTKQLATDLFAKIVNPAYENLKQEKNRKESSAMLRFQVRKLTQKGPLEPKSDRARALMKHPANGVDVFYEQAVAELADTQYQPLANFAEVTEQLGELNLVYLQLKMGEVMVNREKRTGLVAAQPAQPASFTPAPERREASESYDRRHYRRAQEYTKKGAWDQAIQELKDAIKIDAKQSDYHALLGVAYLKKNIAGMARTHLRRALELNPHDTIALRFASQAGVPVAPTQAPQNSKAAPKDADAPKPAAPAATPSRPAPSRQRQATPLNKRVAIGVGVLLGLGLTAFAVLRYNAGLRHQETTAPQSLTHPYQTLNRNSITSPSATT